jgi:hypothetical protein
MGLHGLLTGIVLLLFNNGKQKHQMFSGNVGAFLSISEFTTAETLKEK